MYIKINTEEDIDKIDKRAGKIAFFVLNIIEEYLESKNVVIDNPEKTGDPDEAIIYGEEYYNLEDEISDMVASLFPNAISWE